MSRYGIRRAGRITVTRVAASASTVRALVASIGVVPFATLSVGCASSTGLPVRLTPGC
jgi:hypothetical protein